MNILYEDNHIIAVEKPVNIPVQADSSGDDDMLTLLKGYIKQKYNKPGEVFLGLVHRLDRPVGGVMVFARTSKAASRLMPQFATHRAKKRYAAIVQGEPKPFERLESFIKKDGATGNAIISSSPSDGAKPAALEYARLTKRNELSLVDVELFTGRHHQIRAQLANAGLPIWGDQRYNGAATAGQQVALWAYSLTIEHPTLKKEMTFTSLPSGRAWKPFDTELRALLAGVRIVYADDNILCCNKPAGMGVAQADGGDSLEARLASSVGRVYPVHRLDVATSGLVLFARNEQAEGELNNAMEKRSIRKYYICSVHGRPYFKQKELRAYLVKDAEAARVKIYDTKRADAKEIITRCRVLKAGDTESLIEVELVTGRTHQIRAHLAHEGYPIIGDDKYGDRPLDRHNRGLKLTAVRLEFSFDELSPLSYLNGKTISIQA